MHCTYRVKRIAHVGRATAIETVCRQQFQSTCFTLSMVKSKPASKPTLPNRRPHTADTLVPNRTCPAVCDWSSDSSKLTSRMPGRCRNCEWLYTVRWTRPTAVFMVASVTVSLDFNSTSGMNLKGMTGLRTLANGSKWKEVDPSLPLPESRVVHEIFAQLHAHPDYRCIIAHLEVRRPLSCTNPPPIKYTPMSAFRFQQERRIE